MPVEVKICGLSTRETVEVALEAGADWIGLVFFPKSPRHLSLAEAGSLARMARGRARVVALAVDPSDEAMAAIAEVVRPDLVQLHGGESPERVAEIRAEFGIPVMKAIRIAEAADLDVLPAFLPVVDRFLFDAKPPPTLVGALPGGNGLAFDWRLIRGLDPGRPFMLSGGLTPETVAEAITVTGVAAVDVSSGVESAPGLKDPQLIRAFVAAAKAAPWRDVTAMAASA